MKRWITRDDFVELWTKFQQRGGFYLLSKLSPSATSRTQSTFGATISQHANWWIIPTIRQHWNKMVSGDPNKIYEDYFVEKYLADRKGLKMLALGSGIGSHERHFASYHDIFAQIDAFDIAPNLIDRANTLAQEARLKNIQFHCADINKIELEQETYDIIFFHSSLHHFLNLEQLIVEKIPKALKPSGFLLLNDYWGPNRLQWTDKQIQSINQLLKTIPSEYRKRFRSELIKNKISGPGWLRMRLSDPSEAAESELIQPLLHQHFNILEEKPIGGNILMPLLKDIAHHFVENTTEVQQILERLIQAELDFLSEEAPLLFFGVYTKK